MSGSNRNKRENNVDYTVVLLCTKSEKYIDFYAKKYNNYI